MKEKEYKSAEQYARDDISKSLKEEPDYDSQVRNRYKITTTDVFTKKPRELNKELDLHKINKKRRIKRFKEF